MKLNIGPVDPDDILSAGGQGAGAIFRCQTATTELGTYADLTGTGSTPTIPVVAGDRFYTGWHPAGTTTDWYRVRVESVVGLAASAWSTPFQGTAVAPWYVTSADILTHAGVTSPSATDTDWAEVCAGAVNGAIAHHLVGVTVSTYAAAELYRAALADGVGAYLDRDAPHGVLSVGIDGSAVRLGADILRAAVPVLKRHAPAGIA